MLIVPAWIMKYYILDLSPGNSLVKYLVAQGTRCSSYRGTIRQPRIASSAWTTTCGSACDALKAVQAIVPERKIHAVGYCLGGTLLSIAAAFLARRGRSALQA